MCLSGGDWFRCRKYFFTRRTNAPRRKYFPHTKQMPLAPSAFAFTQAQSAVMGSGIKASVYARSATQACRCGFVKSFVKWIIREDGHVVMFQERECRCPCDRGPIIRGINK